MTGDGSLTLPFHRADMNNGELFNDTATASKRFT
jgi:hypothetical protein